jgi:hypothetical protein
MTNPAGRARPRQTRRAGGAPAPPARPNRASAGYFSAGFLPATFSSTQSAFSAFVM